MGDQVGMIEIQTEQPRQGPGDPRAAAAAGPGQGVIVDWRQMNSALFQALEVERVAMFVVLSLIVLVAVFNILSSLIMLVRAKTRDIAILRTMGASRRGMMKVFMTVGVTIGSLGIVARRHPRRRSSSIFRQDVVDAIQAVTGAEPVGPVGALPDRPAVEDRSGRGHRDRPHRAGPVVPRDALSRRARRRAPIRSRCCAMSEPVLATRGLKRSFTQGDVTIEVLRGVDLAVAAGRDRRAARAVGLGQVDPAAGGRPARRRVRGLDPPAGRGSGRARRRRPHPACAATLLGFVYQFHHLLPDFNARENVVLPQLVRGAEPQAARERAEQLLGALGLVAAARPPAVEAVGRRAAARRGRPRARQQAAAGARRRADRQPRRAHRRHGLRRIPQPRPRRGQRGAGRHPQRAPRRARWTALSGCTKDGSNEWSRDRQPAFSRPMRRTQSGRRSRSSAALDRWCCCWSLISRPAGTRTRTSSPATSVATRNPTQPTPREALREQGDLRPHQARAVPPRGAGPRQRPGGVRPARRLRRDADGKSGDGEPGQRRPARSIARARCRSTCRRASRCRRPPNAERRRRLHASSRPPTAAATSSCCATPMRSSRRWRRSARVSAAAPRSAADRRLDVNERRSRTPRAAAEPTLQPAPRRHRRRRPSSSARPSFDCANARTKGEIAVCSDAGLAALDRNMAAQYRPAMAARVAGPAGAAAADARPLPRLSRPLPEQRLHRRRLCRADARDPRHHGRPLAAAAISRG